jgi:DNA-binding MarR family transcriptional regulator
MQNKERYKKALEYSEKYSVGHMKVINILIDLEVNHETTASVKYLIDKTGLTMPTVYSALKALQKDSVIIKSSHFANTYVFNQERIEQIIEQVEYKQSIPNSSKKHL